MKIFLICPVRNATKDQLKSLDAYISLIEMRGDKIYYPTRDNIFEKSDTIGYVICDTNKKAMADADVVHIFFDPKSKGSLFDLGMAFALNKKIFIANIVELTEHKSFSNMVRAWSLKCE